MVGFSDALRLSAAAEPRAMSIERQRVTTSEPRGESRDALRRKQILAAARATFLRFGFAKTSIDDIARQAKLSRPLIYRKFRNKDEILAAAFEDLFEGRYERVAEVVRGRGSKRAKLLEVYEILYLEPWSQVTGTPMAAELYAACKAFDPKGVANRERLRLKYTQAVLGTKEAAEVFVLSVEGLTGTDFPTVSALRRRIELLVERFA
jgi:TetR/AcrR family transcriptional regulator, transcriptional repressor of aconitase